MKRIHSFLIALALFFAGHSLALAAPDSLPLPGYARITYRVSYGEGGVQVGSSIQELRHDGVRYAMRSHMETTGIFWLLKPVQMTNVSKGEIVAGGFRPNEFSVTRFNGKNETA
ncbi:MAG: DUF3108 domain-containing protein, partial [Zoogloeaceae bacterium]|nr:DUF3108 domain-containing protein [Zoogloeaceae bacterium]